MLLGKTSKDQDSKGCEEMSDQATATNTVKLTKDTPPTQVHIDLVEKSGRYRLGPSSRPDIKHDHGFLGRYPPREPTTSDRLQLAIWRGKLEAAEAFRPDLADATAAYRHFLDGSGKTRKINYERYILNDESGAKSLKTIIYDFIFHASIIGEHRDHFTITGLPYPMGSDEGFLPYPKTENWQKAIGAHFSWASGEILATTMEDGKNHFTANISIHIEDMYNFNPGAKDIATGTPDAANGIFEITGLAKEYMNISTIQRTVKWIEGDGKNYSATSAESSSRERRPDDNRRLRNRI